MNQRYFQKQTDKGWQSMNELLDQQMPIRKRRRPVAAVWWSLALWVLTLLGAGAWWWHQKEATAQVTVFAQPLKEQPTRSPMTNSGQSDLAAAAQAPTSPRRTTSADASEKKGTSNAEAHKNANEVRDTPAGTDTGLEHSAESTASSNEPKDGDAAGDLQAQPLADLRQTTDLSPLPPGPLPERVEQATDYPVGAMPHITKASIKSAKNKHHSSWRVGANLTISTEHFNAANSASAGAVVDWQPKRSHWGIRSGLAYEHYRPSGFARPIAEVNADRYADATSNYAFLFNNSVYVPGTSEALGLDVALPVVLMQRLRVPLLAFWQPVKQLRWYGGSSFSYTLRAHTLREGLAFDEELVGARSASSAARVNKLATQELPRFGVHLQSGLGLHLGKHWELEMNYRQSAKIQFKSLFEKREEAGQSVSRVPMFGRPNHHFFSVSGTYFFGKKGR